MKSFDDVKEKLNEMKVELDELFRKRDNSDSNWKYQEYCLMICNHCEKIKLLEWVLNV